MVIQWFNYCIGQSSQYVYTLFICVVIRWFRYWCAFHVCAITVERGHSGAPFLGVVLRDAQQYINRIVHSVAHATYYVCCFHRWKTLLYCNYYFRSLIVFLSFVGLVRGGWVWGRALLFIAPPPRRRDLICCFFSSLCCCVAAPCPRTPVVGPRLGQEGCPSR